MRAKYDFIAAYELGYADVAFGDLTLLAKKATSGDVISWGFCMFMPLSLKKIRIRLLRFLSKTVTAGTPQAILCRLGSMTAA
ncbi:hypothetical protein [Campylobacter rectus]